MFTGQRAEGSRPLRAPCQLEIKVTRMMVERIRSLPFTSPKKKEKKEKGKRKKKRRKKKKRKDPSFLASSPLPLPPFYFRIALLLSIWSPLS